MSEAATLEGGRAEAMAARLEAVLAEVGRVVVGQRPMVEGMLLGLAADGHVLLEGVPGLAKTLAVRTLAAVLKADFRRIQFTPDLLPADLIGTTVYHRQTGEFTVKQGPVFTNVLLADEINRAPAKVQSALLEAMQERQVTIGERTYPLPQPFLAMATQNPIEQEGTYPLPEAQVDRFLLKLRVGYPSREEEKLVLERLAGRPVPEVSPLLGAEEIAELRGAVSAVFVDEKIRDYVLDLVSASRDPARHGLDLAPLIAWGASPRASLALVQVSRARALLQGRTYVVPEDVRAVAPDVLRHRLLLTYEAEARQLTGDDLVTALLEGVEVP